VQAITQPGVLPIGMVTQHRRRARPARPRALTWS
jgi:hypothetical protein